MLRNEALNQALEDLQANFSDLEVSAVVSQDGLMIASLLPERGDGGPVAAMCAAMMLVGTRAVRELERGTLRQVLVKGDNGSAVITSAGPNAVLLALAKKEARLGLVFMELSRTSEEIEKILAD